MRIGSEVYKATWDKATFGVLEMIEGYTDNLGRPRKDLDTVQYKAYVQLVRAHESLHSAERLLRSRAKQENSKLVKS